MLASFWNFASCWYYVDIMLALLLHVKSQMLKCHELLRFLGAEDHIMSKFVSLTCISPNYDIQVNLP